LNFENENGRKKKEKKTPDSPQRGQSGREETRGRRI